jgi:mannosylglycerate hydrolase
MGHTMHVVSHTHWDREWYLTFQQFRLRLVDLIDHLLDILDSDPDFRYFNLDAQTIVLEDYLQIRPRARARLEKHVREGRITIGPWYQLNDEFLTSGEATVRSLLAGHRIAQEFGAVMKVGYLPDQFGNLSQMPQILRGFGMDNAIMGRGYQLVGDRKMEFWWEAPDGSRVIASLMAFWYNNAQYIPEDTEGALRAVEGLRDTMAPRSAINHLLFMNGVDHLEAKPFIGKTIRAVNEEMGKRGNGDTIRHSTLTQYVDALREALTPQPSLLKTGEGEMGAAQLETKVGELREDRGGACLAGTLSTRMYLKQANHHAQIMLEQYAERLSSFARIVGAAYPYDQLLYAWKLLMQNHPHDSICGCSVDQVHREMMPRFQQVEQIGQELVERALDALTGRDRTKGATEDATAICVFNTLNWARTDPVTISLEFPLGVPTRGNPPRDDSKQLRGFKLTDPDGNEVPFAVTRTETAIATVSNPHELPLDQWAQRVTVEFIAADVPACGYKTYTITPQAGWPQYPVCPVILSQAGYYANYEDSGEVGDEYLHRKPLQDVGYRYEPGYPPLTCIINPARYTGISQDAWNLPASATPNFQARTAELVNCRVVTRTTQWAGVPRIEVETSFENRVRDHRLRALVEGFFLEGVEQSIAEGQYDVIARPLQHPLEAEGASPFHPQQFWVAVTGLHDDDDYQTIKTLTVMNRGLPEYEVFNDERGNPTIAVTLLRCVGQLSGRGDGPGIPTPDSQCLGEHTFHYAILETEGDWMQGQVWKQAHQFNVPLVAAQCPADETRPAVRSFVTVEPSELVVTAIKRAEDRDTLLLRFFNITDEPVAGAMLSLPGAKRVRLVNLNEEPLEEWRAGGEMRLDVGPKKIVTVEFEMG